MLPARAYIYPLHCHHLSFDRTRIENPRLHLGSGPNCLLYALTHLHYMIAGVLYVRCFLASAILLCRPSHPFPLRPATPLLSRDNCYEQAAVNASMHLCRWGGKSFADGLIDFLSWRGFSGFIRKKAGFGKFKRQRGDTHPLRKRRCQSLHWPGGACRAGGRYGFPACGWQYRRCSPIRA